MSHEPEKEPLPDQPSHGSKKADSQLSTKRLLLVEDSEDNQILISQILLPTGIHIDFANDGRAGVKMALQGDYDAILMDIQMPYLDGYQATRQLRQAGFNRPILAITAHVRDDERETSLKMGCDDHLTKPINRRRLIESLKRHLEAQA